MGVSEMLTDRPRPLFIDGDWHAGEGGEVIEVIDPCLGRPFACIGTASAAQVGAAAAASAAAFAGWRRTSGAERARCLTGVADGLRSRHDALVALQMTNNGKPRAEAEFDLADAIGCFEYYAGLAEALDAGDAPAPLSDASLRGARRAAPIGPVGLIVPWNFPLVTSAWKLAPALAAGCTAVLKVSEMTPLAELVYGDIAQEIDLPAGVLNILTGTAEVGRAITTDPHFAKLSFTGSNAVGAVVMRAASERCLPVALELGGKSPIVVLGDSDLDQAVDLVAGGIFMNCGQMCSATSRLIVASSIRDDLLAGLADHVAAMRIGNPAEGEVDMGPLTTRAQYDKIRETFARAAADGIPCLTGGRAVEATEGFFVAPTVYTDVPADHFLRREELFGPILIVDSFDEEAEAIRQANETDFGLAATVVSGDTDRALRVADQIDAGHIWVNAPQLILPESSWGGFKASGIGRELGPAGLAAFQQQKFLTIAADPSR